MFIVGEHHGWIVSRPDANRALWNVNLGLIFEQNVDSVIVSVP